LLKFPDDKRLANSHFALGLLYASKNQPTESTAEYKLVANQFIKSPLAPYALLNSSKVKNNLRDYAGGYNDLKQLVEQFPDTQVANEAYLYYADTAAKANLTDEALKLYSKVYYLGLSEESKFAAALGAGECSWRLGDYTSAEKWLSQCIGQTNDRKNKDLYSAYLLLGKIYAALKNPEASYNAFQYAFAGVPSQLSKEKFIEDIPASVEVYIQQGYLVQALNLLENADSLTLSLKESVEILLLKSRVLRKMGLADKAVAILGDRAEYIIDSQLKAEIEFQLCECCIEKGDLEFAYRKLSEILTQAKPGPLMYEATFRLADVCLKLERSSQTVSICRQLLDLEPPEQIKQKTLELLALAYNQKKNYDKAALALLGQWK
jgi:tetratricopeptide (TPR) repeat protein